MTPWLDDTSAERAQRSLQVGAARCLNCDAEIWRLQRSDGRIVKFDEVDGGAWDFQDKTEVPIRVGEGRGCLRLHDCEAER